MTRKVIGCSTRKLPIRADLRQQLQQFLLGRYDVFGAGEYDGDFSTHRVREHVNGAFAGDLGPLPAAGREVVESRE